VNFHDVGTDPNFLDSFFANSRLSFIGSYKQRTSNTEASNTIASPQGKRVQSKECYKRFVFHVDMDCFFANVVLRKYPQYRDKPVAISHHGKKHNAGSDPMIDHDPNSANKSEKSTSECATCNYHARKFGIKKGMFLGRARQLCPELIVLHYDFAGYEEVSEQVLAILQRVAAEHEGCVEAVSCDEAYMELHLPRVDELGHMSGGSSTADDNAGDIAEMVRKEIFETTQCTASVGVASNKFLAKVGTDRVKPDGTFVVNDYRNLLKELSLRDLHGVGYRSEPKLLAEGLASVQDVWELGSKAESALSKILGPGLGKKIYAFCHGRDDRKVQPVERKTIGAECNYGVRFDGPYGIDYFVNGLALEVGKRMEGVGCKGCKLTLKVKQRKTGAKPPPKVSRVVIQNSSCNFWFHSNQPSFCVLSNPTVSWPRKLSQFIEEYGRT
jgi:DNA repair protein REV1